MKTSSPRDIDVIEMHKENIQPLSGGRSVSKLSSTMKKSNTNSYFQTKVELQEERNKFELELKSINEMDDPLQIYLNYIDWTHRNFPQGANTDSDLVNLLERCTSDFRDLPQYKNDFRYLKIWLEYTNYCDTPRDIYIYLAKKEIGNQLALFYEEFAQHLEIDGKYVDAAQIYELGLQYKAFPLARLQRSYENFKRRLQLQENRVSSSSEEIRNILALKRGSQIELTEVELPRKKSKLDVYQDNIDNNRSVLSSIFENNYDQKLKLDPRKQKIKENITTPTQWNGQVLKQKGPIRHASNDKVQIFCDEASSIINRPSINQDYKRSSHVDNKNMVYTLVEAVGKKPEKIMVNLDLIYSTDSEEFSMMELLAQQKHRVKNTRSEEKSSKIKNFGDKENQEELINNEETKSFSIQMNDDTTSTKPFKDPTVTSFSKMAKNEVFGIFNQVSQTYDNSQESDDDKLDDPTVTNLEGFVTETIHPIKQTPIAKRNHSHQEYKPTQLEYSKQQSSSRQSNDYLSSPFVANPRSFVNNDEVILHYPLNNEMQEYIINNLSIPITTYPGYYNKSSSSNNKFNELKQIAQNSSNFIKGTRSTLIDYLGEEVYLLIKVLNQEQNLYLVETGSGVLKFLKVMSPTSRWEFFVIHRIQRKLLAKPEFSRYFIKSDSLYYFKDESFLVLDHHQNQKSFKSVADYYRNSDLKINEWLCSLLTLELLKAVKTLHEIDIIHGDIRLENVLINFENVDDRFWSSDYSRYGQNGWNKKSILLINFGKAIDLKEMKRISNYNRRNSGGFFDNLNDEMLMRKDYEGVARIMFELLFDKNFIKNDLSQIQNELQKLKLKNVWSKLFQVFHDYNYNLDLNILSDLEICLERSSRSERLKETIKELELKI
ncbi:BUB1 [Candida jiufengensis]|uniref:BUB1 n=1 Tax=Candida jiufengensis TaxID=497108 RepID=UPI0022252541|nr:BUB1 [Candida jiufengensis]KAI5955293.1 BUB1 [Candida jiufengensis]